MSSNDAENFFAESIDKITRHLKEIFLQENGRDISTIILVGGFAESPMLIEGIKTTFPNMRTIIPQEAAWSVLRGAVIFGHDPSLIRQRISRYTYGIHVRKKFDPSEHDEKYKSEVNGEWYCRKMFSKLLEIDEIVTVGEYQKEKKYNFHSKADATTMELYSSNEKNPKYVSDEGCYRIGNIVPNGHSFLQNESVLVKMRFGETEIEFNAYQPKSKQRAMYYLGQ